jgi:glucose/arabinose dehydrogenase
MTRLVAALAVATIVFSPGAQAQVWDYLEPLYDAAPLERPVAVRAVPGTSDIFLVAEQAGRVVAISTSSDEPPHVVMDVRDNTAGFSFHPESGLLGIEISPQFPADPSIFVFYVYHDDSTLETRISRFSTDGASFPTANLESEEVIISLPREIPAHNGGDLHFSLEGLLYISIGDGACCGDPHERGQDPTNLFAALLRIDVEPSNDLPYSIPDTNPFVGNEDGWREEIYAYGLRNPWRFSIDAESGLILLGDVGELAWEEINVIVPGGNYGWNVMEGNDCFVWPPGSPVPECDPDQFIAPVVALDRDQGNSVTGGVIYRGARRPDLYGHYVFADWSLGRIYSLELDEDGEPGELTEMLAVGWLHVSAFGTDNTGELIIVDYFGGRLLQFIDATSEAEPAPAPVRTALTHAGPNPFRSSTALEIATAEPIEATLALYDRTGRRVATMIDEQVISQSRIIEIDGRDLAAGAYFATLTVDGRHVTTIALTRIR